MTQLDFSIVAGNNDTITIPVYDRDGEPVILTGATIKWQLFDPNGTARITKSSQIAIITSSDGVANAFVVPILPADTLVLPQNYYPHEAVVTDLSGNVVTITDNDPILSYGTAFIRTRLTSP